MRGLVDAGRRLQRAQLSVQALSRLSSVVVFLLASWTDSRHLPLVALQGVLFAIPYTLVESLVGRPLSADLVPGQWSVECWARRAALVTVAPVGLVCFLSATLALPGVRPVDRLLMSLPILVQLPLEAAFWAAARTRPRWRANLIPQLTAVGTVGAAALFAAFDVRLDLASLPAQVAVLGWVLVQRGAGERPGLLASVRVGAAYALAAGLDLAYAVALPSVAGRLVGVDALVVLRALELAFGPYHVALAATVREDIVAGRRSRLLTGTRVLTVVLLLVVGVVLLASGWVRGLLAEELSAVGLGAVALYWGYKAVVACSTWASIRHMIWAPQGRFLASAIGSRVLAFAGMAVGLLWVRHLTGLFTQLLVVEVAVVALVLRPDPWHGPPSGRHRRTAAGHGRGRGSRSDTLVAVIVIDRAERVGADG